MIHYINNDDFPNSLTWNKLSYLEILHDLMDN